MSQILYAVPQFSKIIVPCAKNFKLAVPFTQEGVEDRLQVISVNDMPANSVTTSFLPYSPAHLFLLQMRRVGNLNSVQDEEEINHGILLVYSMMMSSIVAVAEMGSQETRLFTLNPELAAGMAGGERVKVKMSEVYESLDYAAKNTILCFELLPYTDNYGRVGFDLEASEFKMKQSQIITPLLSAIIIKDILLEHINNRIVKIEYRKPKSGAEKSIVTSLSPSAVSGFVKNETLACMKRDAIDNSKALSIRLPSYGSKNSNMVDIFIPCITKISVLTSERMLCRTDEFDPYASESKKGKS